MSDYIGQVKIIYPSRTMFRVLSKIKSADCYKCVNLSGTEKGKEHTYSTRFITEYTRELNHTK